jgi:hypothetical protein
MPRYSFLDSILTDPDFTTMSLDNIGRKICEGCEGSEASIKEGYEFDEHKTSRLTKEIEV